MKHFLSILLSIFLVSVTVNAQNSTTKNFKQRAESITMEDYDQTTNEWSPNEQKIFQYNSDNSLQEFLFLYYDSNTNSYQNMEKMVYTYDNNGNIVSKEFYMWNTDSEDWQLSSKAELTYDQDNNLTSYTYSYWSTSENSLVYSSKSEYAYTNGRLSETTGYTWDEGNWSVSNKAVYTYTTNGSIEAITGYYWSSSSNAWKESSKTSYTYDTDGNLTEEKFSTWDAGNDTWADYKKFDFEYDTDSRLTKKTSSEWDGSLWNIKDQYLYYYNPYGSTSSVVYLYKDTNTGELKYSYKSEYYYDIDYLFEEVLLPEDLNENLILKNKLTAIVKYTYIDDNFVPSSRKIYKYSTLSATTDLTAQNRLKVYPNPAADYLYFNEAKGQSSLEIYSAEGKLILWQDLNNNTVDVSSLQTGIYIYKLHSDNKVQTGKFIKK